MTGRGGSVLRRPLCYKISFSLQELAQYRRFWRPTIKYILRSTCFGSVVAGFLFFSLISYVLLERLSFSNMVIPIVLLIGMELASDLSDTFVTQIINKPVFPSEIIYNLTVATFLVLFEIVLWQSVIRFYDECTHDFSTCNQDCDR